MQWCQPLCYKFLEEHWLFSIQRTFWNSVKFTATFSGRCRDSPNAPILLSPTPTASHHQHPPHSGAVVAMDNPTSIYHCHPQSWFPLGPTPVLYNPWVCTDIMTYIHHHSNFTALKILCAPPGHLSIPSNPWLPLIFSLSPYLRLFQKVIELESYHECGLFTLTSFTLQGAFKVPPCHFVSLNLISFYFFKNLISF